uniref:Reverse transcriptase Ty1/copia-type domain-containing protein n=1 Tax=Fagus sylvatica TaxID=28930 RepID=A0A2N9FCT2_FAGSY
MARVVQPANFSDIRYDIPELKGDNYKIWKERVLLHLGWMDIDYAIRKDEPPALTDTSTAADITLYERWERSNRLSMMFIKTRISAGIRGSVDQHEKVRDLLKAIDEQFVTSDNKALASTLIMKFSSLRLISVRGVREHIMQMRDNVAQLKKLEVEMSKSFLGESAMLTTHGKGKSQANQKGKGKIPPQASIKKIPSVSSVVQELPRTFEQRVEPHTSQEYDGTTLRRSIRPKRSTIPDDYVVYLQESDYNIGAENDPEFFSQAMSCKKSELWYNAMKEEMNSMKSNGVWDLVELPNGVKAIGCKWVFKTKKDSLGNIERYKARLIAKGFTQKEGIDYTETFSPVSKKDSLIWVRHLMSLTLRSIETDFKGDRFNLNQCSKNDLEREQMKNIPYASAVGSLMYAQVCTRPDIAFTVGILGRYQSDPGLDHWRAAKKVMRYLQGTKDYMLIYRRTDNLEVIGYSDSDFAGCIDSRKSTSGYIFLMASGAVSWRSTKQTLTATSIMEAKPLRIYCDNSAAVFMAKNNKSGSRSKHIDIKYLAIRERVKEKKVVIEHVSTELMIADPLTKGMPPLKFKDHVANMGLGSIM